VRSAVQHVLNAAGCAPRISLVITHCLSTRNFTNKTRAGYERRGLLAERKCASRLGASFLFCCMSVASYLTVIQYCSTPKYRTVYFFSAVKCRLLSDRLLSLILGGCRSIYCSLVVVELHMEGEE